MKSLKVKTQMNEDLINTIIKGDAAIVLKQIEDSSIDLVLTDPPYFLDRMDNEWDNEKVSLVTDYCNVIKSLPPGMKFEREQGKRFYRWYLNISRELHRVLVSSFHSLAPGFTIEWLQQLMMLVSL